MKSVLRAVAGTLLIAMLFTLTLWRNDAFPDLSGFTQFIQDTAGRLDTLSQIEAGDLVSTQSRPADEGAQYPDYDLSDEIDPELEALIYEGMRTQAAEIDLEKYKLDHDSLQKLVSAIRFKYPDLFFVDKTFGYSKRNDPHLGEVAVELRPQYTHTAEQVAAMMQEYEGYIESIVSKAPADGTDFDKLLYVHDYFVQNYCYDFTYTIRDAHTFFKEKTGVCQAYMLALIAVCNEMGIQSIPVTSNRMNHAWNLVELDGAWYHVDVTWDDTGSYASFTSYAYFLQSDVGIMAIDADRIHETAEEPDWHCDWATTRSADDTRYDNAAWRLARSPMVKGADTYYCVVSEANAQNPTLTGAVYSGTDPAVMSHLFAIEAVWRVPDSNQYDVDCYSGLAIYCNELIYSTHNSLRAYDMITGQDRQIKLMAEISPRSIYGICGISAAGDLAFVVAARPSGADHTIEVYSLK